MGEQFHYLFEPITIGTAKLRNRIVSTAHSTRFAEDGMVGDRFCAYHEVRAKGGVGLIITEAQPVHPSSIARPGMIHNWEDRVIPGFRNLARVVHKHGTKIFGQISHQGRQMSSFLTRRPIFAPSPIPCPLKREVPKGMEVEEIKEIVEHFGEAARRLREGEFDGVEVMIGHGYLLNQFLSPATNKRTDEYGGSLENRLKIIFEVINAVRNKVGDDFTCGVRMSGDEFIEGGLTLEDMKEVARLLEDTGQIDFFDVSGGNYAVPHFIVPPWYMPSGYLVHLSAGIKEEVNLPVCCVGRINDPILAEEILGRRQADLVGMCRALIADPELPQKAQGGRLEDIRPCIGCRQACSGVGTATTLFLGCTVNPSVGYEGETEALKPCVNRKKVLVIGAGPGGLEASRIAASRGHQVVLCEQNTEMGGQVALFSKDPMRTEFGGLIRFLISQVGKLGVETRLGKKVTPEMVINENPDVVIIATGSTPWRPPIPGVEGEWVLDPWQVLRKEKDIGPNVLIIAGREGHQAPVSLAEFLVNQGKTVQILSELSVVGGDIEVNTFRMLYQRLFEKGVIFHPFTGVKEINDHKVVAYNVYTKVKEEISGVDTAIIATGNRSNDQLYKELKGKVKELYAIGDCVAPRKVNEAMIEGDRVGRLI
jgi:mycofactocin system FadH/OYE family oxidoreductase 2